MEQADLILRLLQDFRDETLRRFEQIDKRFEQIDKRFEQVDIALRELKTDLREVHRELHGERRKLEEVYEARERVKITFGWQWGLVSLFIAVVAAGITKIFS
ncbi:MAG: hypothetical protein AAB853_04390 [Patescibacteria group bacterium]